LLVRSYHSDTLNVSKQLAGFAAILRILGFTAGTARSPSLPTHPRKTLVVNLGAGRASLRRSALKIIIAMNAKMSCRRTDSDRLGNEAVRSEHEEQGDTRRTTSVYNIKLDP
jgi:hypothetical protein